MASILGVAANVAMATATQEGWIFFCNYGFSPYTGELVTAPVTYCGPAFGGYTGGETIGTGFTADLLYSLDSGWTWMDANCPTGFLYPSGTAPSQGGGMFGTMANQVAIPGYTSGPVDFIVQVYNGSSYATSTMMNQSEVFEASELATASNGLPVEGFFDNRMTTPLAAFTIGPVPEPATLALGGLGLAALLAFCRKQV